MLYLKSETKTNWEKKRDSQEVETTQKGEKLYKSLKSNNLENIHKENGASIKHIIGALYKEHLENTVENIQIRIKIIIAEIKS